MREERGIKISNALRSPTQGLSTHHSIKRMVPRESSEWMAFRGQKTPALRKNNLHSSEAKAPKDTGNWNEYFQNTGLTNQPGN